MKTQDFNYDDLDNDYWDDGIYNLQFGDEDPHEDDYCCYDPRYTGPVGYCHCKEYAEQEARDRKWYNRLRLWWWVQKGMLIDWLTEKKIISTPPRMIQCDNCGQKFDMNKTDLDCPRCGENNLPF